MTQQNTYTFHVSQMECGDQRIKINWMYGILADRLSEAVDKLMVELTTAGYANWRFNFELIDIIYPGEQAR